MRFSEMPGNSQRQRLATTGIAKALHGLFFSVSCAEDRGRMGRCLAEDLIHGSAERRPTDNHRAAKNSPSFEDASSLRTAKSSWKLDEVVISAVARDELVLR